MKATIIYSSILILLLVFSTKAATEQQNAADSGVDSNIPVIAVISQPATTYQRYFPDGMYAFSEVVGSYVDWIEQTGAEVAMIAFDQPWNLLEKI
jgi:hypothetical protein